MNRNTVEEQAPAHNLELLDTLNADLPTPQRQAVTNRVEPIPPYNRQARAAITLPLHEGSEVGSPPGEVTPKVARCAHDRTTFPDEDSLIRCLDCGRELYFEGFVLPTGELVSFPLVELQPPRSLASHLLAAVFFASVMMAAIWMLARTSDGSHSHASNAKVSVTHSDAKEHAIGFEPEEY